MKSNPISKIGFIITGSIALACMAIWIFLGYKSTAIKSQLVAIEAEAQEKLSESTYSSSARNILRESKENLSAIDNRFISKEAIPEFITMLESQAEKSNVRVTLNGIDVLAGAPHAQLQVKINGIGTWEKAIGFVTTLDSMPYVSRINSLNFTKQSAGDTTETATTSWTFNLEFVQYLKETQ